MREYKYIEKYRDKYNPINCKGILGYISGLYISHTFLFYPSTKTLVFKPKGDIVEGEWKYEQATHLEVSQMFKTAKIEDRKYKGCFAYNPENKGVVLFYESDPDVIERFLETRKISWKDFKEKIIPIRKMIARGLNCSKVYIQRELSWNIPDYIENHQLEKGITSIWIEKYFDQI